MAKSSNDTSSTRKGAGVAVASTGASSASSAPNAKTPTSKERGPSDVDLLNILMVDLNRVQERFGQVFLLRPPGDEPVMFVLSKKLDACAHEACGRIIQRTGSVSYCEEHRVKVADAV